MSAILCRVALKAGFLEGWCLNWPGGLTGQRIADLGAFVFFMLGQ